MHVILVPCMLMLPVSERQKNSELLLFLEIKQTTDVCVRADGKLPLKSIPMFHKKVHIDLRWEIRPKKRCLGLLI